MTLKLYTLSGSPFGWKVQLALAHKHLAHELLILSNDKGELQSEQFKALNPHTKAPVLVDGDFALYESEPIVEYLEDAFPSSGARLWPADPRRRALARRIAAETASYIYPPVRTLVTGWLARPAKPPGKEVIEAAKTALAAQLAILGPHFTDGFYDGARPGAADFALYPLLALITRIDLKRAGLDLRSTMPASLKRLSALVEALPFFFKTAPPHWKEKS